MYGKSTLGPARLNAYLLTQFGTAADGRDISAYGANAGAALSVGPGTLRTQVRHSSGDSDPDDNTIKGLQTFHGEYWYGSHNLALLTRDDYGLPADNGVVFDVGFGGRGSTLASTGYDLPLGKQTAVSCNLGAGWAVESEDRKGSSLGTEANVKLTQQLYAGLTLSVRAAYLFLGNFYDGVAKDGSDPDDPWDARIILAYAY